MALGSREREYLFIDGGCLRSAVAAISNDLVGDGTTFQPLVSALSTGSFDKVFYYDAVPGQNHGESVAAYEVRVQPDHDRFAQIQSLDRVHVALGRIVGRDRRQKGVDVRLAVDMMTAAFRGNISRATLFAGDSDFEPLIRALVSEGIHVTLWHPPQANEGLRGAADSIRPFSFKTDHRCLTRDGVESAFAMMSSGSGGAGPEQYSVPFITTPEGDRYAARWKHDRLTVWRSDLGSAWHYQEFAAPGSTLAEAMQAFEVLANQQVTQIIPEASVHVE